MQLHVRQAQINTPLSSDLNPLLDKVLRQRGITHASATEWQLKNLLHYRDLAGIEQACDVLFEAMHAKQRIMVIGDFDADGATSTALCIHSFRMFEYSNVDYLVPNRFDFGYGLSPQIVDVAHQQGAQVIVTVDNGIACFAGVDRARDLGIKVVITDHHLPAERLPAAHAIVNPNQANCKFASKQLAGVGVAFYLMLALKARLQAQDWFSQHSLPPPNLASLLDIVAVGTVADVVGLDENNRVLVHQGLQRIRSGKAKPGILALFDVAGRSHARVSSSDLGFVIGPRLNAAGRLDDISLGIECLLASEPYQARKIAVQLDALNKERRDIEASMQADALAQLPQMLGQVDAQKAGIVVFREDFHQGVIGILAGRLKEQFHRPCIVFALDTETTLKGSARSLPGIHMRDLLERINTLHPGLINKFGGHAMAAGLSIERAHLTQFIEIFETQSAALMASLPSEQELLSDGQLQAAQITLDNAFAVKYTVPWGQQFEEPIFDGIFTLRSQRIVGEKHLKLVISDEHQEYDAIAFNGDPKEWPNPTAKQLHIAYRLDVNEFRGNTNVQLLVAHIVAINPS
mgnify:CR=1 FL=1